MQSSPRPDFRCVLDPHQVLAVVLPEGSHRAGVWLPQHSQTQAAMHMHSNLFLLNTPLQNTHTPLKHTTAQACLKYISYTAIQLALRAVTFLQFFSISVKIEIKIVK